MDKNTNHQFNLDLKNGGTAFFALMLSYFVLSLIFQTVFQAIFGQDSFYYYVFSSLATISALALIIFVYKKSTKSSLIKITKLKKFNRIYLLLSVLLAIGMMFGLGFVNGLMQLVVLKINPNYSTFNFSMNTPLELIVMIVVLSLLPAIFEELFFRGLVLNFLDKTKPIIACLCVGLIFALYHCSLTQLFYQFIYGVLLTLLAYYSFSVIPCIIAHALNNTLVLILEYFMIQIDLFNPIIICIGLLFLAVFVLILFLINKKNKNTEHDKRQVQEFFFPFGIVAILLCTVLALATLM